MAVFLFLPAAADAAALSLTDSVERAWTAATPLSSQVSAQKTLLRLSHGDRWRRFLPNEPQLGYAKNDDGTAEVVSLTEIVAFPGKSIALARLDRAREEAQRAELQATRYDIAQSIVTAYLDAAVSAALLDQENRNLADFEALQKSLQARYEAGQATQAEVLVTDLQIRQQRADIAALQDRTTVASSHFRRLLDIRDGDAAVDLPDDIDPRLERELGDATSEQVRAAAAFDVAAATAKTASWSQLPDVTVGASKNHYLYVPGSPNGSANTRSFSVGVAIPFMFPLSDKSQIDRQKAQSEADRSTSLVRMLTAERDREDALREYTRSRDRLKELRDHDLPYAEALMQSTLSAYRSGKLGLAEIVLARKTLTDLRAQDIQLRSEIIEAHLRCLGQTGASS